MSRAWAGTDTRNDGGARSASHGVATPGKSTLTAELPRTTAAAVPAPVAIGARGGVPLVDRESAPASESSPSEQHAPAAASEVTTRPPGETAPAPGEHSPGAMRDAPTATYLVPFDRSPVAAPGERIIFSAEFTGGASADYEIAYSSVGGHFTSATGPATLTIQGLISGNVNFFVPSPWNGTDAVGVTMTLKKKSDGSAVRTETWNFGKKAYYPTTMTQREDASLRDLPGIYHYDLGPARAGATAPFYQHQTILEAFDNWSISNIAPEDIKEAYRTAHGLTSPAAITTHFIGNYAGSNGTFTVDAHDRIADQHGGNPNVDNLVGNLAAPKDIEIALPQTYEAQPGTALGRFTITRVHKSDGTWKVKKASR